MVTDTSGTTNQGWQLKGDSVAEERMRKIVLEAQGTPDRQDETKDIGGYDEPEGRAEDTMGAKDIPPDILSGDDGETCRI